jgi:hypothetical protein
MNSSNTRLARTGGLLAALAATAALAGPQASAPEPISDVACLRKLALDLVHRGPTDAELQRVKTKAATLAQLADAYLASAEFSQVVFDWYRAEFPPTSLTPRGTDTEEPARIARHIVVNDRDYRELMTGDYTVLATGGVAPQPMPAAGVLSTRHYMSSALGQYRRAWAGRFQRQWTGIALTAATLVPGAPVDTSRDGLASNPACAGCHVDPVVGIDLLARFADCWRDDGTYDATCTPSSAMFLTRAGQGLPALGQLMTESREWQAQTINLFFRLLFGRALAKSETGYYLAAADAFAQSGFKAKALIRHLVTSPAYCSR